MLLNRNVKQAQVQQNVSNLEKKKPIFIPNNLLNADTFTTDCFNQIPTNSISY